MLLFVVHPYSIYFILFFFLSFLDTSFWITWICPFILFSQFCGSCAHPSLCNGFLLEKHNTGCLPSALLPYAFYSPLLLLFTFFTSLCHLLLQVLLFDMFPPCKLLTLLLWLKKKQNKTTNCRWLDDFEGTKTFKSRPSWLHSWYHNKHKLLYQEEVKLRRCTCLSESVFFILVFKEEEITNWKTNVC